MDSATLAPGQALEALKTHFDLMQKFLDNQIRVSEMVGHHLNETEDVKVQGPGVL